MAPDRLGASSAATALVKHPQLNPTQGAKNGRVHHQPGGQDRDPHRRSHPVRRFNALPLGRHTFRLVVVDDSGNSSIPDDVIVIVADTENPTAVLNAPRSVNFATSFNLDGSRSFDAGGGRVVTYLWTYMGQP
jgi:hypothetical protein